jgi:hypothetical protein
MACACNDTADEDHTRHNLPIQGKSVSWCLRFKDIVRQLTVTGSSRIFQTLEHGATSIVRRTSGIWNLWKLTCMFSQIGRENMLFTYK